MAATTLSCMSIAITGAMLGACVGYVIFATLNAGKRADESEWRSPLPAVEAVLAWDQLHAPYDLIEAAIEEYEHAFGRELFSAGEREFEDKGATWNLPTYAWRKVS